MLLYPLKWYDRKMRYNFLSGCIIAKKNLEQSFVKQIYLACSIVCAGFRHFRPSM